MTVRPVNLREHAIRALRRHEFGCLRRPSAGATAEPVGNAQAGDRLWVREPFHLHAMFDSLAPTQVVGRDGAAEICWSADGHLPSWAGLRRFARELPRALHRAHLVVHGRRRLRLQDLTDEEIAAEGFGSRDHFACHWDSVELPGGRTIGGAPARWSDNPHIVELTVEWKGNPIK